MNIGLAQDSGYLEKAASFIYSDKDSSLFYIEKQINLLKGKNEPLELLEAITYKTFVAGYYSDLTTLKNTIALEADIYNNLSDSLSNTQEGFDIGSMLLYDQGKYHYKLNQYDKARDAFFKIIERIESNNDISIRKDHSFLTVSNSYLALMYIDELKYEVAEEFYNENLRLHKLNNDTETTFLETQNLLAELKLLRNENSESIHLARKSVNRYEEIGPEKQLNSYISTSQLLIDNYLEIEQLDSAQYFINQTKPYLEKRKRFANSFNRLQADLYIKQKAYDKAENEYLQILTNLESTGNHFEKIRIYLRLGKLYTLKEDNEAAREIYGKGLSLINDEELRGSNYLIKKIELLSESNQLLSKEGENEKLELAVKQGQELVKTIDLLKLSFINDSDKQNLINASISGIEYSLDALNKLYAKQENDNHLEAAFQLIENSKNSILLDALTRNKASSFSGIPEDMLEEEKRLRVTINNLQKEKSEESKAELFKVKNDYNNLIELFESDYPKYYQLKYAKNIPSVKELQNELDNNTLFLNFFSGNNTMHIVSVSKEKKRLTTIENSENLSNQIIALTKLLSDPKSDIKELNVISTKLYEQLLKPVIQDKYINIIIAADGVLHYLPFEALFNGGNYVVDQYICSYVNSASLLSELKSKPTIKKNKLLAFAPRFSKKSNDSQLQPLPNNEKEANTIAGYFRGSIFKGEQASKASFADNLESYNILHLATHAIVDNETPEYSYLAFTEDDTEDSFLYVNDLYATNMNAKLITLSACETGLGKLQKGEGMISLSRAFFYAGASSIAHTLWKANDNSSSQIMQGFYEELSEGKPKNEALRNAKLNFINANSDNNLSHPYYWAGFVISGDTTPVTSSNKKWAWFLVVLVPVFLVISSNKRRRNNAA
ncbi:CHAT domain-containing protein [Spongiivirga citrea]|uniref:CHAT domain-containing protein n=1 Tax=Spongiivirga citrea TaxID=1481457 RepID=A0A6M0CLD6_9FLAO|nr:CHAT domain-containing protein [Spongiivirga citrea]NER18691.1 CHAT domain-containing protein [Spongiivirga citrea]